MLYVIFLYKRIILLLFLIILFKFQLGQLFPYFKYTLFKFLTLLLHIFWALAQICYPFYNTILYISRFFLIFLHQSNFFDFLEFGPFTQSCSIDMIKCLKVYQGHRRKQNHQEHFTFVFIIWKDPRKFK